MSEGKARLGRVGVITAGTGVALVIIALAACSPGGAAIDSQESTEDPIESAAPAVTPQGSAHEVMVAWAAPVSDMINGELHRELEAAQASDRAGTIVHLRRVATLLGTVSVSPGGGQVSALLHKSGASFGQAADLLESGDETTASAKLLEAADQFEIATQTLLGT